MRGALILMALAGPFLGGCRGSDETPSTPNATGPVAAVTIWGPPVMLGVGVSWAVTARDANGFLTTGGETFWRSSNVEVAEVYSNGMIVGISLGTAFISATLDGVTGGQEVTVNPGEVLSILVVPDTIEIAVGEEIRFSAVQRNRWRAVIPGGTIAWEVADSLIAGLTSEGVATGRTQGETVVAAYGGSSGTIRGSAILRVRPDPN